MTTNTHALAVETDTKLLDEYIELNRTSRGIESVLNVLHDLAGHRRQYRNGHSAIWVRLVKRVDDTGRDTSYTTPVAGWEAVETVEKLAAASETTDWNRRKAAEALDKRHELRTRKDHIQARIDALNATWEANGRWSRFFLVTNSNGHIHSSMGCSTCRPSTNYAFLVEMSGMSEAEAVEAQGPVLCSKCFPSAPVEWVVGKQTKEQRKAAKARPEIHP